MLLSQATATEGVTLSVSPKSRLMIVLLSCPLFLGIYGPHRIYVRDYWWGSVRLLGGAAVTYQIQWNDYLVNGKFASLELGLVTVLIGVLIIWSSIDFMLAVIGKTKDANGQPVIRWW